MNDRDITELVREYWDEVLPDKGVRKHYLRLVREHTRQVVIQCLYWFTQTEAARWTNTHRGTICRAVKRGRLVTNGEPGRECRIDPSSLFGIRRRRKERERVATERWAEGCV